MTEAESLRSLTAFDIVRQDVIIQYDAYIAEINNRKKGLNMDNEEHVNLCKYLESKLNVVTLPRTQTCITNKLVARWNIESPYSDIVGDHRYLERIMNLESCLNDGERANHQSLKGAMNPTSNPSEHRQFPYNNISAAIYILCNTKRTVSHYAAVQIMSDHLTKYEYINVISYGNENVLSLIFAYIREMYAVSGKNPEYDPVFHFNNYVLKERLTYSELADLDLSGVFEYMYSDENRENLGKMFDYLRQCKTIDLPFKPDTVVKTYKQTTTNAMVKTVLQSQIRSLRDAYIETISFLKSMLDRIQASGGALISTVERHYSNLLPRPRIEPYPSQVEYVNLVIDVLVERSNVNIPPVEIRKHTKTIFNRVDSSQTPEFTHTFRSKFTAIFNDVENYVRGLDIRCNLFGKEISGEEDGMSVNTINLFKSCIKYENFNNIEDLVTTPVTQDMFITGELNYVVETPLITFLNQKIRDLKKLVADVIPKLASACALMSSKTYFNPTNTMRLFNAEKLFAEELHAHLVQHGNVNTTRICRREALLFACTEPLERIFRSDSMIAYNLYDKARMNYVPGAGTTLQELYAEYCELLMSDGIDETLDELTAFKASRHDSTNSSLALFSSLNLEDGNLNMFPIPINNYLDYTDKIFFPCKNVQSLKWRLRRLLQHYKWARNTYAENLEIHKNTSKLMDPCALAEMRSMTNSGKSTAIYMAAAALSKFKDLYKTTNKTVILAVSPVDLVCTQLYDTIYSSNTKIIRAAKITDDEQTGKASYKANYANSVIGAVCPRRDIIICRPTRGIQVITELTHNGYDVLPIIDEPFARIGSAPLIKSLVSGSDVCRIFAQNMAEFILMRKAQIMVTLSGTTMISTNLARKIVSGMDVNTDDYESSYDMSEKTYRYVPLMQLTPKNDVYICTNVISPSMQLYTLYDVIPEPMRYKLSVNMNRPLVRRTMSSLHANDMTSRLNDVYLQNNQTVRNAVQNLHLPNNDAVSYLTADLAKLTYYTVPNFYDRRGTKSEDWSNVLSPITVGDGRGMGVEYKFEWNDTQTMSDAIYKRYMQASDLLYSDVTQTKAIVFHSSPLEVATYVLGRATADGHANMKIKSAEWRRYEDRLATVEQKDLDRKNRTEQERARATISKGGSRRDTSDSQSDPNTSRPDTVDHGSDGSSRPDDVDALKMLQRQNVETARYMKKFPITGNFFEHFEDLARIDPRLASLAGRGIIILSNSMKREAFEIIRNNLLNNPAIQIRLICTDETGAFGINITRATEAFLCDSFGATVSPNILLQASCRVGRVGLSSRASTVMDKLTAFRISECYTGAGIDVKDITNLSSIYHIIAHVGELYITGEKCSVGAFYIKVCEASASDNNMCAEIAYIETLFDIFEECHARHNKDPLGFFAMNKPKFDTTLPDYEDRCIISVMTQYCKEVTNTDETSNIIDCSKWLNLSHRSSNTNFDRVIANLQV